MTLSLPTEKIQKLRSDLEFFKNKYRATKRQIQKLCGCLAHAAKVIYGGQTFS